jgi:RimJ/RimL family protein N-acetyltransferase
LALNTIDTTRLLIRRLTIDDLQEVHRIYVDLKWDDLTLEQHADWLHWAIMNDFQLERLYQPPYGDKAVVLKETNQLIGLVGLVPAVIPAQQLPYFNPTPTPDTLLRPEPGLFWAFDPAYQDKGYATEAAQGLTDFIFTELRFEHVIATTDYANERSQAVMRRLGMNIQRNPFPDPFWCQIVGVLKNPHK